MSEKKEPRLALELYLVRHGQSQGNIGYEGINPSEDELWDPKLTELGQKQAELLGERFSDFAFDHILASPYARATATGYAVAMQQPENGCHDLELHPLFCECGMSENPGKTIETIRQTYPNTRKAVGAEGYERLIYNDKTPEDEERMNRAKTMIKYLTDRFHNGEKVLVAAHACFNTFLIFAALGLSTEQGFDFANGNTGVTKILFYEEGTGKYGDRVLVYHNDQSHLFRDFRGIQLDET
ncbi:MAG TPA: hypothetical protein DDY98_08865 [Ruminococcaceae bacterium]|nr:hypothetical protein [Oscillospiraceae bacterium]